MSQGLPDRSSIKRVSRQSGRGQDCQRSLTVDGRARGGLMPLPRRPIEVAFGQASLGTALDHPNELADGTFRQQMLDPARACQAKQPQRPRIASVADRLQDN